MRLLALAASVAGIAVSIYLTAVHYAGVPLACPRVQAIDCEAVLSSPYGLIAGTTVPTAVAGIVWFAANLALWLRPLERVQLAWAGLGMVTVLYLVFIEIVRLGTICVWCTVAHFLVLTIFLIALSRITLEPDLAGEAGPGATEAGGDD